MVGMAQIQYTIQEWRLIESSVWSSEYGTIYLFSCCRGKHPWALLKHTCTVTHSMSPCIGMKISSWVLTREWALAWATTEVSHKININYYMGTWYTDIRCMQVGVHVPGSALAVRHWPHRQWPWDGLVWLSRLTEAWSHLHARGGGGGGKENTPWIW